MLLPPTIKHYFPNRIGALTSLYLVLVTISASLPSLVAVRVTDAAGWRVSVGMSSLLGFVAVLPWLSLIQDHDANDHPHKPAIYAAQPLRELCDSGSASAQVAGGSTTAGISAT